MRNMDYSWAKIVRTTQGSGLPRDHCTFNYSFEYKNDSMPVTFFSAVLPTISTTIVLSSCNIFPLFLVISTH
jgi:hypothetical protein